MAYHSCLTQPLQRMQFIASKVPSHAPQQPAAPTTAPLLKPLTGWPDHMHTMPVCTSTTRYYKEVCAHNAVKAVITPSSVGRVPVRSLSLSHLPAHHTASITHCTVCKSTTYAAGVSPPQTTHHLQNFVPHQYHSLWITNQTACRRTTTDSPSLDPLTCAAHSTTAVTS